MSDEIQIARFDYVRQADGSFDWCVEVTVTRQDQFSSNGTRTDRYGPLTPEDAKAKFDVDLTSVLSGINSDVHEALTSAQASLADTQAELSKVQTDLAATQAALDAKTTLLEQVYNSLTPHV